MKYSLQKNNPFVALSDNFKDTLSHLSGLVVFGSGTGFLCLLINSSLCRLPIMSNHPMIIAAGTALPFIVMYNGLAYLAKGVFKNFKRERERVSRLALNLEKEELQKQSLASQGTFSQEQMNRIHDMNDFNSGKKVVNIESYRLPEALEKEAPAKRKSFTINKESH